MRHGVNWITVAWCCAWVVMGSVGWTSLALADAPSSDAFFGTPRTQAAIQNPSATVEGVRSSVNALAPTAEACWDIRHGDWFTGSSVALWNITDRASLLASLRAGTALTTGIKPYAELQLDLPNLARRALPSTVLSALTASPLDGVWGALGKYGQLGVFAGYDFEHDDGKHDPRGIMVGVTLGGRLTF